MGRQQITEWKGIWQEASQTPSANREARAGGVGDRGGCFPLASSCRLVGYDPQIEDDGIGRQQP